MRHLIIDQSALESFRARASTVDDDVARLCTSLDLSLHVLYHDHAPRLICLTHGADTQVFETPRVGSTQRDLVTHLRANESCQCSAACCVRDAVLSSIDTDDMLYVVIKDERSFCLTSYADRIFAAGQPLKLCSEHAVPHHPVVNWSDCARLIQGNTRESTAAQIRRQARLHRMDAIKTE